MLLKYLSVFSAQTNSDSFDVVGLAVEFGKTNKQQKNRVGFIGKMHFHEN